MGLQFAFSPLLKMAILKAWVKTLFMGAGQRVGVLKQATHNNRFKLTPSGAAYPSVRTLEFNNGS